MTYAVGGVKPLTPAEAGRAQISQIPDIVFIAVNNLLSQKGAGMYISFSKESLLNEIRRLEGPTEEELYANKWLDVEPAYRLAGWDVEYDNGDWGSGPGYFKFTKRPPPNTPQPR